MIYILLISLMCVVFEVNSYTAQMTVPKVKGKCEINGKLFKPGQEYMEEQKCERWTCSKRSPRKNKKIDKTQAFVSVAGCGIAEVMIANGSDCRYKSTTGKYPDCCFGELDCNIQEYDDIFDFK